MVPKTRKSPKETVTIAKSVQNLRAQAIEEIRNLLFTWIEECLTITPGTKHTTNRDLYSNYRTWVEKQGDEFKPYILDPLNWGIQLRAIGYPATKFGGEKVRWGMVIRSAAAR